VQVHLPAKSRCKSAVFSMNTNNGDAIDAVEVLRVLWQGRWVILGCLLAFFVASVAYAFVATEWYRAEVLLAPAKDTGVPALGGELGGLAALAGVNVGTSDSTEPLAILKSRAFARSFIEEKNLLPVLMAEEWDASAQQWSGVDPADWPDIRDGVEYFHEEVLEVRDERQTGLVTLSVLWTDSDTAAVWANELAQRLNREMRDDALAEAETNIEYLRSELKKTNVVMLQQSIGRLLETELQKVMLARGNEEFAFQVIDAAVPPKDPFRPRQALIVVFFTMLGGGLASLYVVLVYFLRPSKATEGS